MRRTLSVGLVLSTSLAVGVASCSSTPPPTPAPTVETPSWDPRRDAIDQAQAIWERQRPPAYAYTLEHAGTPGDDDAWTYRVSGLEGGVQVQLVSGAAQPADAAASMSVEGLFDAARAGLASDGFTFAYDRLLGHPTSLAFAGAAAPPAGGGAQTVEDFETSADTGAANRARTALEELLRRARGRADKAWEYTWTRTTAGAADAADAPAEVWAVRHDKKGTTAKAVNKGDVRASGDDVTLDATAFAISTVLGGGGWVDVSLEAEPGLGALIAVDPSPSVKGDAYWIRIAWTDLVLRAALSDIQSARARWATAQLTDYAYTWKFDGAKDLVYKVARKGGTDTVTPQGGTPAAGSVSHATPSVEDTFALIEAVLDQGGTVKATYDDQLGYPKRIELTPKGDGGAKGVITIGAFKRR